MSNEKNPPSNKDVLQIDQPKSTVSIDCSLTIPAATTISRHVNLVSSVTSNIKLNRGINKSLSTHDFDINLSIIKLPDRNSQLENRPSTSTIVQLRTMDILCSIEFRELEKKNRELTTKVDTLKAALKQMGREQKKMKATHMCE
ncbi:unnamed protein product [Rotaria sp. Silwood2]|nr:unnamed protein product [Rotaria sp. Silwood2]